MDIVFEKRPTVKAEEQPQLAPEPKVVIPTPEELRQRMIDAYSSMGWGAAPEPKETSPAPAAPTPETPAAPATPAPTSEGAAGPGAPEVEREPSTTDIIARTARETAREVATILKPEPAAAPAPASSPGFELTPEDSEDLEAIRYLERNDPRFKGKGMADKFLAYVKAHYEYRKKWEAENPGKTFEPEDSEHEAWISANQPDIDARSLDKAKIDMAAERKVEEMLAPERKAKRQNEAWHGARGRIGQQVNGSIVKLVELTNPDLKKLVTNEQGQPALDDDHIKQLETADPVAREVLDEVTAQELEPFILELEKTTVDGLDHKLNPQKNPLHATICNFVTEKERELAAAPADERTQDGKQWMSLEEYARRMNRGESAEDLDRNYWTLSVDMVEELWVDRCAKKARGIIEKRDGTAKKKYGGAPTNGTPPKAPTPPTPQPTPPGPTPAGFKPKPPSGGGQADIVTTVVPGKGGEKTFADAAIDLVFSR